MFSFINGGIISEQMEHYALYLSGTYCHKTGIRPSSCVTLRQLTIYVTDSRMQWDRTCSRQHNIEEKWVK